MIQYKKLERVDNMRGVKTWNQSVVKKGNKSIVLDTIRESQPISRAHIANETGLNKGTVSSLVNELLAEQLVYESGPGESSGGRRPVLLHFNKIVGYSIGIDLGVNYMLGVLTDLEGNIVHEHIITFTDLSYTDIEQKLTNTIDLLIAAAPPSHYGIIGIGIGVPGIVDNDGNIIIAPNLGWHNIRLHDALETKYDIPIIVQNEANAGAYGEKRFGVGKDFDHIIYLSIAMGIGVGLILHGELYKGNDGFSGELGHMTINVNGDVCSCGSKGCWELFASEQALINSANEVLTLSNDSQAMSLEHLIELAEENDEHALRLFEEIGEYIGIGIKNIFNTFNPEQVIIGNRLRALEKWITNPIHKNLINQTLWPHQGKLQVDFSELSSHSTTLGIAAFTIEHFLEESLHQQHIQI